jgi:hypothetical protein
METIMNLTTMRSATKLAVSRNLLKAQKHSPTILVAAGIAGMIGTVVLASKATLKLEPVIDQMDNSLAKAKAMRASMENGGISDPMGDTVISYTEQEFARDKVVIYTRGVLGIVKLYGPAATLGVASIAAIVGGHRILSKRNVALAAAYTTLEKAFNKYRERVIEEIGPERERALRYSVIEEEVTDKETGEVSKQFQIHPSMSIYARFFDESSKHWEKDSQYNNLFLRNQQSYANNRLQSVGHVFLNEVYDMLGIERTPEGQLVGWVRGHGDDFIDFGLDNPDNEMVKEFVNGFERSVLLDFNVDGVVYHLI